MAAAPSGIDDVLAKYQAASNAAKAAMGLGGPGTAWPGFHGGNSSHAGQLPPSAAPRPVRPKGDNGARLMAPTAVEGGDRFALTAAPELDNSLAQLLRRVEALENVCQQERSLRLAFQDRVEELEQKTEEQDEAIDQIVQLAGELHARQLEQGKRLSAPGATLSGATNNNVTPVDVAKVATTVVAEVEPQVRSLVLQASTEAQVAMEARLDESVDLRLQGASHETNERINAAVATAVQELEDRFNGSVQALTDKIDGSVAAIATAAAAPMQSGNSISGASGDGMRDAGAGQEQKMMEHQQLLEHEDEDLSMLLQQDIEHGAAEVIQACWRGTSVRTRRWRRQQQQQQQQHAAQTAGTDQLRLPLEAREEAAAMGLEVAEADRARAEMELMHEAERTLAATDIQAVYRGHRMRTQQVLQRQSNSASVPHEAHPEQQTLPARLQHEGPHHDNNRGETKRKPLMDQERSYSSAGYDDLTDDEEEGSIPMLPPPPPTQQYAGMDDSIAGDSVDDEEVDEDDCLAPAGPPHIPAALLNNMASVAEYNGESPSDVDSAVDWARDWERIAAERRMSRASDGDAAGLPARARASGRTQPQKQAQVQFATDSDHVQLISPRRDEEDSSDFFDSGYQQQGDESDSWEDSSSGWVDGDGSRPAPSVEEHVMAIVVQTAYRGFAVRRRMQAQQKARHHRSNSGGAATVVGNDGANSGPQLHHVGKQRAKSSSARSAPKRRVRVVAKAKPNTATNTTTSIPAPETPPFHKPSSEQRKSTKHTSNQKTNRAGVRSSNTAAVAGVSTDQIRSSALFQQMRARADGVESTQQPRHSGSGGDDSFLANEALAATTSKGDWEAVQDAKGRLYYHNIVTGETSWEIPSSVASQPATSSPREAQTLAMSAPQPAANKSGTLGLEPPTGVKWPAGIRYNPQSQWELFWVEPGRQGGHYFVRVGDNNPNADLQTEWDQPLEGVRAVNDDD